MTLPTAEALRVERARAHLTLHGLSRRAHQFAEANDLSTRGLSVPALSRIERGEVDPEASTLYAIAGALGIPAARLLPDLPTPS